MRSVKSSPKGRTYAAATLPPSVSASWAGFRKTAQAASVPAFVVFTDATLTAIAEQRPADLAGLAQIVGIGQRTTLAGAAWLMQLVPDYEIVPIYLSGLADGEDVLHLDCSFLPVGDGYALIYPGGMREIPAVLRETYELIEVTREEQQVLGTNVLSISPTCVVSQPTSTRINAEMRARGIDVLEVPYSEPPKTGGSFRCCTLPLHRSF